MGLAGLWNRGVGKLQSCRVLDSWECGRARVGGLWTWTRGRVDVRTCGLVAWGAADLWVCAIVVIFEIETES